MTGNYAGMWNTIGTVSEAVSTAIDYAQSALFNAAVVGFLTAWIGFWGVVVQIHLNKSVMIDAVFTTVAMILPAVAALVWFVGRKVGHEPPTPDVDVAAALS